MDDFTAEAIQWLWCAIMDVDDPFVPDPGADPGVPEGGSFTDC